MNVRSVRETAVFDRGSGRSNEVAILDAALATFGEKGFNGASMRDTATNAGTSLSNLYNYFPSKADLLATLLRLANDELFASITGAVDKVGDGAADRLAAAVKAHVGFVVQHQALAQIALSEIRYLSGSQRDQVVAARDSTQAIYEHVVADGAANGEFATPHPRAAARTIASMCAAISTWYRRAGRLSESQLGEQHARFALALLEADLHH